MALTTRVQRMMVTAVWLCALTGCAPPAATNPTSERTSSTSASEMGQWVASCTNESVDAERMLEDVRKNAPELVHMSSPDFGATRAKAEQLFKPLEVCSTSYIEQLAWSLPSAWQTSSADRFARLLVSRGPHPSTASPLQENTTPLNDDCPSCVVVGSLNFAHPKWGEVRLEAYAKRPASEMVAPAEQAGYRVVAASGSILFNKRIDDQGSILYDFGVLPHFKDGFMFISYNPGRYEGIIVLRATAEGITDFGSDSFPGNYSGRFYSAKVEQQSDGTFAIIRTINSCMPSCANGTYTKTTFTYDAGIDDFVAAH